MAAKQISVKEKGMLSHWLLTRKDVIEANGTTSSQLHKQALNDKELMQHFDCQLTVSQIRSTCDALEIQLKKRPTYQRKPEPGQADGQAAFLAEQLLIVQEALSKVIYELGQQESRAVLNLLDIDKLQILAGKISENFPSLPSPNGSVVDADFHLSAN